MRAGLNTALDPNPIMVPRKSDRRPNVNLEVPAEVEQNFASLEEGDPPNPRDLPAPAKHEFCSQPEATSSQDGHRDPPKESVVTYILAAVSVLHLFDDFPAGGFISLVPKTVHVINPIAMMWNARYPIAVENCYMISGLLRSLNSYYVYFTGDVSYAKRFMSPKISFVLALVNTFCYQISYPKHLVWKLPILIITLYFYTILEFETTFQQLLLLLVAHTGTALYGCYLDLDHKRAFMQQRALAEEARGSSQSARGMISTHAGVQAACSASGGASGKLAFQQSQMESTELSAEAVVADEAMVVADEAAAVAEEAVESTWEQRNAGDPAEILSVPVAQELYPRGTAGAMASTKHQVGDSSAEAVLTKEAVETEVVGCFGLHTEELTTFDSASVFDLMIDSSSPVAPSRTCGLAAWNDWDTFLEKHVNQAYRRGDSVELGSFSICNCMDDHIELGYFPISDLIEPGHSPIDERNQLGHYPTSDNISAEQGHYPAASCTPLGGKFQEEVTPIPAHGAAQRGYSHQPSPVVNPISTHGAAREHISASLKMHDEHTRPWELEQSSPTSFQVSLTFPGLDPDDLPEGSIKRMFEQARTSYPGLDLLDHAIRKGSLLIALDVLTLGAVTSRGNGDKGNAGNVWAKSVPKPKEWLSWLQLPWPKDGDDVFVQIGSTIHPLHWDESQQEWVDSPSYTASSVHTPVLKMVEPMVVHPSMGNACDPAPFYVTNGIILHICSSARLRGDIKLRARSRGKAVAVSVVGEATPHGGEVEEAATYFYKAHLDFGETPCFGNATHNVALEVWVGRVMVQCIPILVLPEAFRAVAADVGRLATSLPELSDGSPKVRYMLGVLSKLGMWLEFVEHWVNLGRSAKDGKAVSSEQVLPSAQVTQHMLGLARFLLDRFVVAGQANAAHCVLKGLVCVTSPTLGYVGHDGKPCSQFNLLHTAMSSNRASMVLLVDRWAAAIPALGSWYSHDLHGVTPLHMLLSLDKAKMLVAVLTYSNRAQVAWFRARGLISDTPAELTATSPLRFFIPKLGVSPVLTRLYSSCHKQSQKSQPKPGGKSAASMGPSRLSSCSSVCYDKDSATRRAASMGPSRLSSFSSVCHDKDSATKGVTSMGPSHLSSFSSVCYDEDSARPCSLTCSDTNLLPASLDTPLLLPAAPATTPATPAATISATPAPATPVAATTTPATANPATPANAPATPATTPKRGIPTLHSSLLDPTPSNFAPTLPAVKALAPETGGVDPADPGSDHIAHGQPCDGLLPHAESIPAVSTNCQGLAVSPPWYRLMKQFWSSLDPWPNAKQQNKFIIYKMEKMSMTIKLVCLLQFSAQMGIVLRSGFCLLSLNAIIVACLFSMPIILALHRRDSSAIEKLLLAWSPMRKLFSYHIHITCPTHVYMRPLIMLTVRIAHAVAEPIRLHWTLAENLSILVLNYFLPTGVSLHWILLCHALGLLITAVQEIRYRKQYLALHAEVPMKERSK
eukprot:gene1422-32793_t